MPPLSLYIHIPWCIRKCPYCDFNSHKSPEIIPEEAYVQALIEDLRADVAQFKARTLSSIFIGGGTPSLFSAQAFERLFIELKNILPFAPEIEITLEANPGSVEQQRFKEYRQLGVNRLSLGIQSFNSTHLKALGRIHDAEQAHKAIHAARQAGFDNLNLDLMHGLPKQSPAQGLADLNTALSYQPEHLSWYQLTIEPNTLFYKTQPKLPSEHKIILLEEQGFERLAALGYERYEISAFSKPAKQAQHNLNYWFYGDYFGIGAGAHGKLTTEKGVFRTQKHRQPQNYQNPNQAFLVSLEQLKEEELIFEFMLNTTRLEQPIPFSLFTSTTGLALEKLLPKLKQAQAQKLLCLKEKSWQITELGRRFTNDLQALFLP